MSTPTKRFSKYDTWRDTVNVHGDAYTCPNCEARTAPHKGYNAHVRSGVYPNISICPQCNFPTVLVTRDWQIPAAPIGVAVGGLPANVRRFYDEARRCATVEGWDAVALLCRTLILHVAVECGAEKQNAHFEPCVTALNNEGWIPRGGRDWVDHVRTIGNKAAHKADPVTPDEARMILTFVELLLRNVYEAKALLGSTAPQSNTPPTT